MNFIKYIPLFLLIGIYPVSTYEASKLAQIEISIDDLSEQKLSQRELEERFYHAVYIITQFNACLQEASDEFTLPPITNRRLSLWNEINLSPSNRNLDQILQHYFETIEEIANKDLQEQVWLKEEDCQYPSFNEFLSCHLIYGQWIQESNNLNRKILVDHQIIDFIETTQNFLKDKEQPDFIDSVAWSEIVQKANEILKEFQNEEQVSV